jgi:hypothetical protein
MERIRIRGFAPDLDEVSVLVEDDKNLISAVVTTADIVTLHAGSHCPSCWAGL